jgi:Pentapeptide repeats (8 copies)
MANPEHVGILKQGAEIWNKWREENPDAQADLRNVTIVESSISGDTVNYVNLSEVNLTGANLSKMDLQAFDFSGADLSRANLKGADLQWANLSKANLHAAKLNGATMSWANLSEADLSGADLTGCKIYAISAWNVRLDNNTKQKNLIITRDDETTVTVDNLEVAQSIYLLLNNSKIRNVINTITSKIVLILGRFTDERKPVLDVLRDELRKHNYSPVVFDFDPSAKRDLTETISLLARMSRFVIADLTDAKSIPQELENIVPHLPSVPVQPILHIGATEYAMFEHYERYPWVLPIYRYQDIPSLLASIKDHIIKPVEQRDSEKEKTKKLEEEVRMLKEKVRELEGK